MQKTYLSDAFFRLFGAAVTHVKLRRWLQCCSLFTFLSVLPPLRKLLILIDCCVMCRCRSSKRAAFRPTLCHSTAATSHALRYCGTMVLWSEFWVLRGAAAVQADQKSMSCPGEAAAQPTGLALIKHLSTAKK